MTKQQALKLFEEKKVRTVWDDEQEKWYFSIVDVVNILTESTDGRKYWNKLKQRLKEEGNETVTNCHQLKMQAVDGKMNLKINSKIIQQINDMKTISNKQLTIQVSPHGAELCSIVANGKEYLWQADPAFWKRHSPVLFPIVGSVWENEYRNEGIPYTLTQHGFARDMEFTLISEKEDEVRYRLVSNEETLHKYPFPFCLEIGYRIQGKKIEVMWEVKNTGDKEMYFQIGAHPAFYWPEFDASNSERGFFRFDKENGLKYILISEKGCADPSTEYSLELTDGLLPLDTHTFDKDALILENEQVRKVTLYNKEKLAYLSLHFNAPVVGLWSPPAKNAPFVCIEPWYGRCDRAHYTGEYKDKDWMQHLQPEEIFQGGYTIEIDE